MKVHFILSILIILVVISSVFSRGVSSKRRKHLTNDYEASGDYFEVDGGTSTIKTTTTEMMDEENGSGEMSSTMRSLTTEGPSEIDVDNSTCSTTNITQILSGYELDNHVLAIFKVNVSADERALIL